MNTATRKQPEYTVYVIELHTAVLSLGHFADANPAYVYEPSRPPIYVGMTAHTPEKRFDQHRNGYKASRYTRDNAIRLRMDIAGELVFSTRAEAEAAEALLANVLRSRGYAVWQN